MITDSGDMNCNAPPAIHWYLAATSRARPAAVKPIFPVNQRR